MDEKVPNPGSLRYARASGLFRWLAPAAVVVAYCWLFTGGMPWAMPGHRSPSSLVQSLVSDDPQFRAAACESLSRAADDRYLPLLIPRVSDSDWRVRAAAFMALDRFAPFPGGMPLRDTPMARREQVLLEWIGAHDARSERPLLPGVCDLFARPNHIKLASTLMARCLECHAPRRPLEAVSAQNCAACHRTIYSQWAASSHAQSLWHLRIPTVDPATREAKLYDFGNLRGIDCTVCHRPTNPMPRPATTPAACAFSFEIQSRESRCAACHADVQSQWELWRRGRQPRRVSWPPATIDPDYRGDDRSCADCHMSSGDSATAGDHRLTARRDPPLLRTGLDVRIEPPGRGRVARLVLTNLAGHHYPAGTTRRALRIDARFTTGDGATRTLQLARFVPPQGGYQHLAGDRPALRPGQSLTVAIDIPDGATALSATATYLRNRFDPAAMTVPVTAAASAPALPATAPAR